MDHNLSSVVKLADLNDYLAPAQECVPDVKPEKPELLKATNSSGKASISLADCLACSGCVTTAEAVLIESQNQQALANALVTHSVVVSVSAISEATLMAYWNIGSRTEFYERMLHVLPEADEVFSMDAGDAAHAYEVAFDGGLVASHCPGVVLYAEKTPEAASLVPMMNTAAPTEVWQGAIVKGLYSVYKDPRWMLCKRAALSLYQSSAGMGIWPGPIAAARQLQLPSNVYHVAISSCMDKKIPRPEFDMLVDLSLTTTEFLTFLEGREISEERGLAPLRQLPMWWSLPHRLAWMYGVDTWKPYHHERASGSMAADYIENQSDAVTQRTGFNADHIIYEGARDQLHVASGLRNLKNMSKRSLLHHQVVLLACPKGCFSGAGQAGLYKADPTLRRRAEVIYQSAPRWRIRDVSAICADARRVLGKAVLYELHEPSLERAYKANAW